MFKNKANKVFKKALLGSKTGEECKTWTASEYADLATVLWDHRTVIMEQAKDIAVLLEAVQLHNETIESALNRVQYLESLLTPNTDEKGFN